MNRRVFMLVAGRSLAGAAVGGYLMGCGSSTGHLDPGTGFINQTNGGATDAQLQTLWQWAQQDLATNGWIKNGVAVDLDNAKPIVMPPLPQALGVQPDGLEVVMEPGNAFPCGSPTGYCAGLTVNDHEIRVAQKYILSTGGTGWEMENVILMRLGQDVSGR